MEQGGVGKVYHDGEIIIRQGEVGSCLYVIQSGTAEVVQEVKGRIVSLAVLGEHDIFGEMALFEHQARSETVRALGAVRVLSVDKNTLLRRIHEDPALAFALLEYLCLRIRNLDSELAQAKIRT